jgi:hypothetical protein
MGSHKHVCVTFEEVMPFSFELCICPYQPWAISGFFRIIDSLGIDGNIQFLAIEWGITIASPGGEGYLCSKVKTKLKSSDNPIRTGGRL